MDYQVQQYREMLPQYLQQTGRSCRQNFPCVFPQRHKNGDAHPSMRFSAKTGKCYCFACCKSADVFDIIGADYGTSDFRQQKQIAVNLFGGAMPAIPKYTQTVKAESEEPKTDYTEYYRECARHISETDYHRGLSPATLRKYLIGYDEFWRNPKSYGKYTERLIIPVSRYSYIARAIGNDDVPKCKVGGWDLFGRKMLMDETMTEPIFITEGEIDAMSIADVGCHAIALGGVSNVGKVAELIPHDIDRTYIIALDNDDAGRTATERLSRLLSDKGINYLMPDTNTLYAGKKDENEALINDREGFAIRIKEYLKRHG